MKKRYKKVQNYMMAAIVTIFLLSAASAGVTYAYLYTDPGTAVNAITVGNIEIELKEDAWDRDRAQELHPGETAAKDPTVVNTGANAAYVFLEVVVPMRDFSAVTSEGVKTDSKVQEVFHYTADTTAWELIDRKVKGGASIWVYGYREIVQPGMKTKPLFSEVTAVNYLEGSLDTSEVFDIEITAKAIQDTLQNAPQSLAEIYSELEHQKERDYAAIQPRHSPPRVL